MWTCVPDPADPTTVTDAKRTLGLVVCRGTNVFVVMPEDGFTSIENPFLGGDEAEE